MLQRSVPSTFDRFRASLRALRRRRPQVLLVVAALAVLVSLLLLWWFSPRNPELRWEGPGARWGNFLGVRLTGVLAGYVLLLQLTLMARLGVVEQRFTRNGLAKAHRRLGGWLFALVALHVGFRLFGLLTNGRPLRPLPAPTRERPDPAADAERLRGWDSVADFLGHWEFAAALVGLVFLLALGLTSLRVVRRALAGTGWWYRVHLGAYVVAVAALPHELFQGTTFDLAGNLLTTLAFAWWCLLVVSALAAVVVSRWVLPRYRLIHKPFTVAGSDEAADGVVHVYVRNATDPLPEPGAPESAAAPPAATTSDLTFLGFEGGQYGLWYFPEGPGRFPVAHAYSLSDVVSPRQLRLTFRAREAPEVGRRVWFAGPYGTLLPEPLWEDRGARFLFLGSGTGMTPIYPAVKRLLGITEPDARPAGQRVPPDRTVALEPPPGEGVPRLVVVNRARTAEDLLFDGELRALEDREDHLRGQLRYLPLVGRRGTDAGRSTWLPEGHDPERCGPVIALARMVPDVREREIVLSGREDWMDQVEGVLHDLRVAPGRIHRERRGW